MVRIIFVHGRAEYFSHNDGFLTRPREYVDNDLLETLLSESAAAPGHADNKVTVSISCCSDSREK